MEWITQNFIALLTFDDQVRGCIIFCWTLVAKKIRKIDYRMTYHDVGSMSLISPPEAPCCLVEIWNMMFTKVTLEIWHGNLHVSWSSMVYQEWVIYGYMGIIWWLYIISKLNLIFYFATCYPLVNVYITIDRSTIFSMGKLTISMGHGFNSKVLVITRG